MNDLDDAPTTFRRALPPESRRSATRREVADHAATTVRTASVPLAHATDHGATTVRTASMSLTGDADHAATTVRTASMSLARDADHAATTPPPPPARHAPPAPPAPTRVVARRTEAPRPDAPWARDGAGRRSKQSASGAGRHPLPAASTRRLAHVAVATLCLVVAAGGGTAAWHGWAPDSPSTNRAAGGRTGDHASSGDAARDRLGHDTLSASNGDTSPGDARPEARDGNPSPDSIAQADHAMRAPGPAGAITDADPGTDVSRSPPSTPAPDPQTAPLADPSTEPSRGPATPAQAALLLAAGAHDTARPVYRRLASTRPAEPVFALIADILERSARDREPALRTKE